MKFLKYKQHESYNEKVYLFKYKKHYYCVEHQLLFSNKTVVYSTIYFIDDLNIFENLGATAAYCHGIAMKIRFLGISYKPYEYDVYNENVYKIYIKNKINSSNYSKRKILKECFNIYEIFTQKME